MALPVVTVAQMRAWEQATWAAGVREEDVIARVGERIAAKVRQLVPRGSRVLLLAGKGNNGNDVRAAEPHLTASPTSAAGTASKASPQGFPSPCTGYDVVSLDVLAPADAQAELDQLLSTHPALIVDGLFGIGLNRALSAEWCRFIEAINASGLPVLAVDVPSGLDADSGGNFGAAVKAFVTLTVGTPKRGLIQEAAIDYVGRLEVAADVGLLTAPDQFVGERTGLRCEDGWGFQEAWTTAEDFSRFPPRRDVNSHKGTYGHLVIVAGSLGYHGAAVLAARGAGAARPGLVTVLTSPAAYPAVAGQLSFAMVRPWSEPMELPSKASAVLVGPGLAGTDVPDWLRAQTLAWWRELPLPLVVDASALDWLGTDHRKGRLHTTQEAFPSDELPCGRLPSLRVLTPHPGEASRWFPNLSEEANRGRLDTIQHLAKFGGIAVLKGHQTLIRGADFPTFINPTGNPGLAQGGSGDVLAGFIGGLLAQPALQRDPLRTVRYAVWEHGAAADRLEAQRHNWTSEDLAAELGR